LAILLTVANGPRYGLEIIRHLEEFTDLVITEGTVYPILGRLTAEGLLTAEWNASEGPHPRKYYRLTDSGRERLAVMAAHWKTFIAKIARLIDAAGGGQP
jgi:PadR family transcriptional regulator PadR